jgi:hypothetical protein
MIYVPALPEPRWYIVQRGDFFDEIFHNIGGLKATAWHLRPDGAGLQRSCSRGDDTPRAANQDGSCRRAHLRQG